ncbi:tRNA glutamyl-Q(34) synthetase GluQRS [Arcanobacterium buesumense]|uniref:tRNA glutamyl-Q(34) synthetase GluQRS n=1 Tax=Arcanobacterium buesumense TaxID=2722751 RepID=A0A6H2EK33_9ACTO|nr:tRNA glutamyl-Q(34) synthetase GluQRS [Arcanobacterium buesumense]QJC21209.1 tRNA glutamyl-Q(34) synthetase GluQRS [Arcanobacterium buesumense]
MSGHETTVGIPTQHAEKESSTPGKGRFAPSPTGDFHLGNLRTALLAWAFARHTGRDFHMRIEDLDDRSRPQYIHRQLGDLETLGIDWDGPEIRQSQRLDRYEEIYADLRKSGALYECYCTRKELATLASAPHQPPGSYAGTCRNLSDDERVAGREKMRVANRKAAFRLRTTNTEICLEDRQLGVYQAMIDDFVIRRGDGVFSYNFVSVVDDGEFGVTQIVRGDDLLSSTPRQIYLQQQLGYATPEYAHVPLVLNTAGARLAKRDGAVTLSELTELGWSVGDIIDLIASSLGMGCAALLGEAEVTSPAEEGVASLGEEGVVSPGIGGTANGCKQTVDLHDGGHCRSDIRTAREFLTVFDPKLLPRTPWYVDVARLAEGPQVWFSA